MNLLIFGAPGAGKGTQSKDIAAHFGLKKISTGDILREEVKTKSELGKKILSYMEKGLLVTDDIVDAVVQKNLPAQNFILDGYPRTLLQAKKLNTLLHEKKSGVDAVLFLDVLNKTAIARLSGRRVCKKCGANFHIKNIPPLKEGICDSCGSALIQRDDDKEATIIKRLEVYVKESVPLIEYYKAKIIKIDANVDKDAALAEIVAALKKING